MATIKDIAAKLGVAVSTVSKGLNGASDISDELRELVLDTAIEMGYVSKRMRTEGTRKLCIFIENMDYENIDFFAHDVVIGFKHMALKDNWHVTVVPVTAALQENTRYDAYMMKNGYTAAFLLGFTEEDRWIKQLSTTSFPTVLLDNFIPLNPSVGYVGTDSNEGIFSVISHLKQLGHTRIAFLNGPENSMISQKRHQAFLKSMESLGLTPHKNLIQFGYYGSECAKYFVPDFLELGATAIVCSSDIIAAGVIDECKKKGFRIPEDVSIIGFDDLPLSTTLTPPLTTIRQNRLELGKSAYLSIDGLIHNIPVGQLLLRPNFIQRESTSVAVPR